MSGKSRCVKIISVLFLIIGFECFLASLSALSKERPKSKRSYARSRPRIRIFTATANSVKGITALGTIPHEGIVAADPAVLPMGSHIRIHGAGKYSGEYLVKDKGRKVKGRIIDIYVRDPVEAKQFGRRKVKVEVLRYGKGAH